MSFRFGAFTLDREVRQLLRDGTPLHLTPKAFDLLIALIEARPRAVSKQDLQAILWPSTFVGETSLTTLVNELRTVLADRRRAPRFIRTVHGFGYSFCASPAEEPCTSPVTAPAAPACFLIVGEQRVRLPAGETVVGRAALVFAGLEAASVSRAHARIMVADGRATIEDLASKNGTYVAGARVTTTTPVRDGDEIRFGHARVTFRVAEDAGATETILNSGALCSRTPELS